MKQSILVTGAGRGIGRSISVKLAQDGFAVHSCARTQSDLVETRKLAGEKINISNIDVTSQDQLTSWIDASLGENPWGLVTAAGIYGPIGSFVDNDWKNWKSAIEVNLYGTALACKIFAQRMIKLKKPGRILLMSGGGATQPLPNFSSYCAAKAAVVRFGETLAHELKPYNISVVSLAPGAVNTKLTEELIAAGPKSAGQEMYNKAVKQKEDGGTSPDIAASFASYFFNPESPSINAKLISAVWDPWKDFGDLWSKLESTDVYTLKRIVPEDRPQFNLQEKS
jgi:NAD(P)-dependent dehydrogenase (short-subunit alcohol dehydrogenase family)